jgi:endonuclease-3
MNKKREMALEIHSRLKKVYPDAHCELVHQNPYELLIATILSAQCTDVRVNMVTPSLFKLFPTPDKMAAAPLELIEKTIQSINFYKNKSKSLKSCSQILIDQFNGEVPRTIEELSSLPGVGRKTANVVLGNAFNINLGIVVDTHVKRTTNLLGLTKQQDPTKIEQDLIKLFPNDLWTEISHLFIFLGRRTCIARRPQCDLCLLSDICEAKKKSLKVPKPALKGTK